MGDLDEDLFERRGQSLEASTRAVRDQPTKELVGGGRSRSWICAGSSRRRRQGRARRADSRVVGGRQHPMPLLCECSRLIFEIAVEHTAPARDHEHARAEGFDQIHLMGRQQHGLSGGGALANRCASARRALTGSSPDSGSSRITMAGAASNAAAICTFCWLPFESCSTFLSAASARLETFEPVAICAGGAAGAALSTRRGIRGRRRPSGADRGRVLPADSRCDRDPRAETDARRFHGPLSGLMMSRIVRISVVFPAPFGPTRPKISPARPRGRPRQRDGLVEAFRHPFDANGNRVRRDGAHRQCVVTAAVDGSGAFSAAWSRP